MLKWLQYETVLGPEDGDVVPKPEDVGRHRAGQVDEEKAVGGGAGGMVITGPGLGDLLTEGPQEEVSLLRVRLLRISEMLSDRVPESTGRL